MSENKIRVRFAPSPTGFLHVGSLRTVLFDFLIAKSLNGKLILRIEDTDQKREIEGAVDSLIDIIDWAGIKFDEGPHIGGEYGPYIQTQRLTIYSKFLQELINKNAVYHCFCTPERLDAMRHEQALNKMPPRYDRHCRNLSQEEIKLKLAHGEKYVIRQKMPMKGEIVVFDELKGEIRFMAEDLEDHILVKSNGIPTYQLANVVDDHTMEISHVLRGDEWISSLPKNILLYQAFGWEAPKYIHLPLTLNKEGGKLSKRQGDVAVEDFRNKGYLPEAMINFSVLQGWHPSASSKAPKEKKDEVLSIDEMIAWFDYKDMGTSPSVFDIDKLDYFNGYYIRQKSLDELTEICLPHLVLDGIIDISEDKTITNQFTKEKIDIEFVKKTIATSQDRLKKLSEISSLVKFYYVADLQYETSLLYWKKITKEEIIANLQSLSGKLENISEGNWDKKYLEDVIIDFIKVSNGKNGDYLWPMRAALTGLQFSPGPFEVAEVLGKAVTQTRIASAIKKLEQAS